MMYVGAYNHPSIVISKFRSPEKRDTKNNSGTKKKRCLAFFTFFTLCNGLHCITSTQLHVQPAIFPQWSGRKSCFIMYFSL